MIITEAAYLEHYGVKGMQWGKRNPGNKDVGLKKGTKVYNISSRTERDISGQVYTAHKLKDVLNYRANYAAAQTFTGQPVFSNAFEVTKNVRAAGRKTQVEAFKKIWDEDPSGTARALADVQKDMKFAAAINARVLKLNRDDVYHKRIMNKGDKWLKTKGLQEFNASIAVTTKSISGSKSSVDKGRVINEAVKQKYFNELKKRGYNAVVDLNDVKNYGSQEPLLIFKGNQNLKRIGPPITLTEKEIGSAFETYMSQKKLKTYRDTLHKTK